MRALLVRVGADQTEGGGRWNAPVNSLTWEFAYVPIPETKTIYPGLHKPYSLVAHAANNLGRELPVALRKMNMHLDPDFSHLTYGDQGERAKQISSKLGKGDLIVFYAALADINPAPRLIYAIIGLYVIDRIVSAMHISKECWDENAHTRRILPADANDIVLHAQPRVSGRLVTCLPIGEYRDRAYRVTLPLVEAWGGLTVRGAYLQRSARLPEILDANAFYEWFKDQRAQLVAQND